jgi:2-iminobutanoate/2-iminopropanoate deaminase
MDGANMLARRWNPTEVAAPIGPFSHLAGGPGATVHIAGQIGVDADGVLAGDTLAAQTAAVFANIGRLLAAAGAGPENLVRLLSFVVGPVDLAGYRAARDEVYGRWFPAGDPPAHSLAFVAGLAAPELLIEVEGTFVVAER